jgi:F-type H+-transporting ATPase subunit epsilon
LRLFVITPSGVGLDEEVDIVTAQAEDGSFGLLPRHVDFASSLVTGLLGYRQGTKESFVGVDGGILIKRGREVRVATPRATQSAALGQVQRLLRESIMQRNDAEKKALRALRKLEADVVRRIVEQEGTGAR